MGFVPNIPADAQKVPSRSFHVGGIALEVFGLEDLPVNSKCQVAFFLHGRLQDSAELLPAIWHLKRLGAFECSSDGSRLLLVTFDLRNHGKRVADRERNLAWADGNELHAQDMLSIQTGTASDISLIIDYLESVVFPHGESVATRWTAMGASLGGHATWIAGARDPRITHLVPIIGSPTMYTLLKHRAENAKPPFEFAPPRIPRTLLQTMKRTDPENNVSAFKGKSILVLSGADDKLVNYVNGGSEAFVKKLLSAGVDVKAYNQTGVGHQVSMEMLERTAQFLNTKMPSRL